MTENQSHRLSVAPMMDWTDRHCRAFHRVLSRRTQLYTEMVTAQAVVHGERERLLGFDAAEHPVVLQLGGSDPSLLAQAARAGADFGYDEINLNVGCPSDRVQSGCFGAALMRDPALVGDCVAAMTAAQPRPVTVKCRIGVDDQAPEEVLPAFVETVSRAGADRFVIHARKAWLKGLSPKENREIPPLQPELVLDLKARFPHLRVEINGGIATLDEAADWLGRGLDGVMIGRAAYHDPFGILARADTLLTGETAQVATPQEAAERMRPLIAQHLARGGRLHQITRHMLGLFAGRPGARVWRRMLSEGAGRPDAGLALYDAACAQVAEAAARAA
ncbi:MAG: tRNA dihydrouridine(20/20a) synthase DusA [Gemmobacter sp.]